MFNSIFYNAKAEIKGSIKYPNIHGTVYFDETKNGVMLTAKITGLPTSKKYCKGNYWQSSNHT